MYKNRYKKKSYKERYKYMTNAWTKHPNQTVNPQGYWKHGIFAFLNCINLIFYSILGIIHSVFPFWFKFSTSTAIIKCFKKLVDSERHQDEIHKVMPNYIKDKYLM